MTRQQQRRLRVLSELERQEAKTYTAWCRMRRDSLLYLTYCVVGAVVFWNFAFWASAVLLVCGFVHLSCVMYSVIRFRCGTGVWPWNPIRRIR